MPPTSVSDPDVKAITVFLASTATPERGGLPYLDAVLPAEDRLAATRVVRDLGALPPDAILYLLAQPLLDLASDHLMRDRDLTTRRGWPICTSRIGAASTAGWSAVGSTSSGRRAARTPPICGRRASSTDLSSNCAKRSGRVVALPSHHP